MAAPEFSLFAAEPNESAEALVGLPEPAIRQILFENSQRLVSGMA